MLNEITLVCALTTQHVLPVSDFFLDVSAFAIQNSLFSSDLHSFFQLQTRRLYLLDLLRFEYIFGRFKRDSSHMGNYCRQKC